MNITLPTLSLDASAHWELLLPSQVMPAEVAKLIVSEDGVYIEFITGDYDLITWDDIADIAVPGRGAIVAFSSNGASGWPAPQYIIVEEDSPNVIPLN